MIGYSREQVAQFHAAFASLSVVGPLWTLPTWPSLLYSNPPAVKVAKKRGSTRYRMLTAFGKTQPLHIWAREYKQVPHVIGQRIDRSGWSVEEAITGGRK